MTENLGGEKDVNPSKDGIISIENTFRGQHIDAVLCVCFSPDQSKVCSVCRGGKLTLWDTASSEKKAEFSGHHKDITFVEYSPSRLPGLIATSSNDKDIRFWDPENTKGECLSVIKNAHRSGLYCIKFDWTGKTLYSGSKDKTIKKWDVERRKSDLELVAGCWVNSVDIAIDDNMLVSGHAYPYSIKIWDVRKKSFVHEIGNFRNIVSTVKIQPKNNNLIASGDWFSRIKVFDVRSYKLLYEFCDHSNYVSSVCFHPSGDFLLSGSDDKTIKFFNLSNKQNVETTQHSLNENNKNEKSDEKEIMGKKKSMKSERLVFSVKKHTNYVNSVCFSSNGKHFLSGSYDKTVILWKLNMGIRGDHNMSKEDENERKNYLLEKMMFQQDEEEKDVIMSLKDIFIIRISSCSLTLHVSKIFF